MFDVRFLPNPHYEPELRPLTGKDPRIVEFIDRDGLLDEFYDRLHPLLDYLLPQYLAEGKSHLVVAIGCTGGRHRSVAIAEHLAQRYQQSPEYAVEVIHRDTERPGVIDHVGFDVTDLDRSARFYDAVFFALGAAARVRARTAIAYGVTGPEFWIVVTRPDAGARLWPRGARSGGKAAVDAAHRAGARGRRHRRGPPGPRPQYGRRYYAGLSAGSRRAQARVRVAALSPAGHQRRAAASRRRSRSVMMWGRTSHALAFGAPAMRRCGAA